VWSEEINEKVAFCRNLDHRFYYVASLESGRRAGRSAPPRDRGATFCVSRTPVRLGRGVLSLERDEIPMAAWALRDPPSRRSGVGRSSMERAERNMGFC
jgi:hypothetical protein